jgi:hypothetical protein
MDLLARVKAIVFAPGAEWRVIVHEPAGAISLAVYVALLATIPAMARFIGGSLVGISTSDGILRVPVFAGLVGAVAEYALVFVTVLVVAIIINLTARRFGGQRNFDNALKLSTYSFTPYWLASICLLMPGLRFLSVLGLYGSCLVWTGLPRLMRAPPESLLGYVAAVVVGAVAVTALAVKLPEILLAYPRAV